MSDEANDNSAYLSQVQSAAAFSPRVRGLTLTDATLSQLRNAVTFGRYPLVKVVTAWGLPDGWTDFNIDEVLKMSTYTIVRTRTGDQRMLDADSVPREIQRWYDRHARLGKAERANGVRTLQIEIGNEPNIGRWAGGFDDPALDDRQRTKFIWDYRWHLDRAVTSLRQNYPRAGIITTALSPTDVPHLHRYIDEWLEVLAPMLARGDFVGLHIFGPSDFYEAGGPYGPKVTFMTEKYNTWFGPTGRAAQNKPLILSEYGLGNPYLDPCIMGYRYAGLAHFGESATPLSPNVWAATYYHFKGGDRQVPGNPYDAYYPHGDRRFRQRIEDPPPPMADRLCCGGRLVAAQNDFLRSPNGRYKLIMQSDSNLVLYGPNGDLWSSGTYMRGAEHVQMQSDGNLVVYASGYRPLWDSRTHGHPNAALRVQDDGNVVIYKPGLMDGKPAEVPIWSTGTNQPSVALQAEPPEDRQA